MTEENGNGMVMPVSPMYGGNGCNGFGFGGDWGWIILILLLAGNGGWGNGFGGGNGSVLPYMLNSQTDNSISRGFDNAAITAQLSAIQSALNSNAMAYQQGFNAMQAQFANCCCENRLSTCQQTNELSNSIASASQRNVDAIADLKSSMISEFCAARERDMQSKIDTQSDIITQLRGQLDNDRQTAQFTSLLAPIQAQVNTIAAKQINTVPVAWPNLTAVNTTPYAGSMYGFGGISNGLVF
jgi:hypothetical protein